MARSDLWTLALLLCLLCRSHAGLADFLNGAKCGSTGVKTASSRYLRIVGGSRAPYGSHPWLVSLKFRASHFCAAAVLTDRWLLTAAHCFITENKSFLGSIQAVAGDHDHRVLDRGEQRFGVKRVIIHEQFRQTLPMNNDVALLELQGRLQFGDFVQPVCLPLPGESFPPKTTCTVAGWGRTTEGGSMAPVLREVQLDVIDPVICKHVLQVLRPGHKNLTVLCAGPEKGGRDACQGDSGGPLVCPRPDGHWEVVGITSWGKGCGRSWINNNMKPPNRRSSPAVFTNVLGFTTWLLQKVGDGGSQCNMGDEVQTGSEGLINHPTNPSLNYSNNEMCSWSIIVPGSSRILLEFLKFDLEDHPLCHSDHLTVFTDQGLPIGRFCGNRLPAPLLIQSNTSRLQLTSDFSVTGSGFSIRFRALKDDDILGPSCGTVALFQSQEGIQSPDYPRFYRNNSHCRWVIYAPEEHIVKLHFDDFDLEVSDVCTYDSLSVFADFEATEELVVLCGDGVPPAVLSYDRVMLVEFSSDSSVSAKGFSANLSFISKMDLQNEQHEALEVEHKGCVFESPRLMVLPYQEVLICPSLKASLVPCD